MTCSITQRSLSDSWIYCLIIVHNFLIKLKLTYVVANLTAVEDQITSLCLANVSDYLVLLGEFENI